MTGLEVPPWITQYGPFGALALTVVLLILRGYLQPKSTVQEVREADAARAKQAMEVAHLWQAAFETERAAHSTNLQAVTKTFEIAELTLDIVRAWDYTLQEFVANGGSDEK